MTTTKLIQGESKNIKFKITLLPKDSEKYTKTINTFTNTPGRQLIIGIDDRTRTVVGMDKDNMQWKILTSPV